MYYNCAMLEQDQNNQDFEKVVELLTPKFQRTCQFSFTGPRKGFKNKLWGFCGIAAMFVVVVAIAIRSTTAVSASEVINTAFDGFDSAETVKVEFVFDCAAKTGQKEIYSPGAGRENISGTLYLLRRDGNVYVRVDWHDAEKNSIVFDGSQYARIQNNITVEKHRSLFGKELIELLNLNSLRALLKDDVSTSSEGGKIIAESTNGGITLRGEFNTDTKQLISASATVTQPDGKQIPIVETQSIETDIEIPDSMFSVF